ncbi:unnamed protein product [Lampetra fluviatilis]
MEPEPRPEPEPDPDQQPGVLQQQWEWHRSPELEPAKEPERWERRRGWENPGWSQEAPTRSGQNKTTPWVRKRPRTQNPGWIEPQPQREPRP